MHIGILGTGIVGQTIGSALIAKGHEVMLGSRSAENEKGTAWAAGTQGKGSVGTFAEAAAFGEILFNCTLGIASLDILRTVDRASLDGKILVDISNPLDFSAGFPPSLTVCNTDSLGEQIQREFPELKVVKALNTMNCMVMVDPGRIEGDHNVFLSGNDAVAKARLRALLQEWFGWKNENVIDLGDITTARGTEMLLPIWVRIYGATRNPDFNFHVVAAPVTTTAEA